jgi:hypothetical protein
VRVARQLNRLLTLTGCLRLAGQHAARSTSGEGAFIPTTAAERHHSDNKLTSGYHQLRKINFWVMFSKIVAIKHRSLRK